MTYFEDLSEYRYLPLRAKGEKNVGWLDACAAFTAAEADPAFVDRLWRYCAISVHRTRGLHDCHVCSSQRESNVAARDGRKLLIGSAEIRVFSSSGAVYAAPNLIYHYVSVHGYRPPAEFVEAVMDSPSPDSQDYFELLTRLGVEWHETSVVEGPLLGFQFVKDALGNVVKKLIQKE